MTHRVLASETCHSVFAAGDSKSLFARGTERSPEHLRCPSDAPKFSSSDFPPAHGLQPSDFLVVSAHVPRDSGPTPSVLRAMPRSGR